MYLKYLARLFLISSVLLTLTASLTQSDNGVIKDKTYVFIPSLLYSMWIAPITGFPKMELNKNDYESTNTASPKKEGCPNLRWRKCKEKRLKIIARDWSITFWTRISYGRMRNWPFIKLIEWYTQSLMQRLCWCYIKYMRKNENLLSTYVCYFT